MPYDLNAMPPTLSMPQESQYLKDVGWGHAARETKRDYFHNSITDILNQGTNYANYLTATETGRHQQSLDTLTQGAKAFEKPSMNDLDIRRMYSGKSDQATRDYSANLGNLRATLGAAGVGPSSNYAAGLASRYGAMRQASLTDATRSLYEKRIDTDMADRMALWQARQAVAAKQSEDPSVIGLDWMGQSASFMAGMSGAEDTRSAAKDAAQAAKDAGWMSFGGSALSAGLKAI